MSTGSPLDDIDRAVLHLLQNDARNTTAVEIADVIGIADGTVRNRINKLEEQDIIRGYAPIINFPEAGYEFMVRFTCTASIIERKQLTEEILGIDGVIAAVELMTGTGNIEVHAVGQNRDEISRIGEEIDETGVQVENETLISDYHFQMANHFYKKACSSVDVGSNPDASN